jgi:hypothetical protein
MNNMQTLPGMNLYSEYILMSGLVTRCPGQQALQHSPAYSDCHSPSFNHCTHPAGPPALTAAVLHAHGFPISTDIDVQ